MGDVTKPPSGHDPQPPPAGPVPPAATSVAFLLQAVGRLVREQMEAALRTHDTSLRHTSALGHLLRHPGLSYSELARRADITVQSMQATVEQLCERGWIERRTPPGRGRSAQLHLTAAGTAALRQAQADIEQVDARVLDGLAPDERQLLTRTLLRLLTSTTS